MDEKRYRMDTRQMLLLILTLPLMSGCCLKYKPEYFPMKWEYDAQKRIEEIRKDNYLVRVVDGEGRPVEGARLEYKMTRHAFPFGTCIRADRLANTEPGDPYRERAKELFNRATLGNYYKWRFQEEPEKQAMADAATEWMLENDMSIHAHVLIWSTLKYGATPKDVKAKIENPDETSDAYLRKRSMEHIRETASRYRGLVDEWDVVNENFSEHEISKVLYPELDPNETPILLEWFDAAREADPRARLYVNDFGILVGDQEKHKAGYEKMIGYLLENDAPVEGIGLQAHYVNGWQRRTPEQLMETLDRFGRFGLRLQVTEFDMWGKGWGETQEEVEAAKAEYLRMFYKVLFSHPSVDGITMWGFWDGQHWMKDAPLFRKDWTPKPAYEAYRELVFGEWWTEGDTQSDAEGYAGFRGFKGQYDITVKVPGKAPVAAKIDAGMNGTTVRVK